MFDSVNIDWLTENPLLDRWFNSRPLRIATAVVFFAVLPFVPRIGISLANRIVIYSIVAIGYNLLLGYTGEFSFGHAAFFGAGTYTTIIFYQHLQINIYAVMVLALLFVTVMSAVYGWISLRRRGIYFAMITLALAQMTYHVVLSWGDVTGGYDGVILRLYSAPIGPIDPFGGGPEFYVVALVLLALVYYGVKRIVNSPFGSVIVAIRENEGRAAHLGYNPELYLLPTFTASGAIAGFGGIIYAMLFAFASPELIHWLVSGEIVLMTILGGVGTLVGPIIGSAVFIPLSTRLPDILGSWRMFFGALVIVIVIAYPKGIYGHLKR